MTTLMINGTIGILVIGIIIFTFIFYDKKRKEIMLIIASCIIALLIGEFFLRIFFPQIAEHNNMFDYDATLGWKFVPNGKGKIIYAGDIRNTIEINSLGFRDRSPSSDKKKKLLVLGDSFVSNISIKDNEVFTEIMEEELHYYDVLNFGVNGYGQVQEYLLLQEWFDEIAPDVIVLIIYLQNDFLDNTGTDWLYTRPYASLESYDSILTIHPQSKNQPKNSTDSWNILSQSHLYRLVTRTLVEKGVFSEINSKYVPQEIYSCNWPVSEDYRLMFRIMEKLLLKIATFGKEKDVPVVFALAPSIVQVEDEMWISLLRRYGKTESAYRRSLPNERLMQFAKRNNLLMLDFFPVLYQENKKQANLYHPFEQHWTKEGNQLIADCLLDYLKFNSLIE